MRRAVSDSMRVIHPHEGSGARAVPERAVALGGSFIPMRGQEGNGEHNQRRQQQVIHPHEGSGDA